MAYEEEFLSSSSTNSAGQIILSFDDDEEFVAPSSSDSKGVIKFFNTPGRDRYLFVRMLRDPIFEADILLRKGQGTEDRPIINHWRAATAIKKSVPFDIFNRAVGFLFVPETTVGVTTYEKIAWGKRDLGSCDYGGLTGGKITVTWQYNCIEKNPIGKKLEEIRKRIFGQWPDMTTKELYRVLYNNRKISDKKMAAAIRGLAPAITDTDLNEIIRLRSELKSAPQGRKDPTKPATRYSGLKESLRHNEVLIHPTKENMLGIVIVDKTYLNKAKEVQKYFAENGGPHLSIFMYTPGNLELVER